MSVALLDADVDTDSDSYLIALQTFEDMFKQFIASHGQVVATVPHGPLPLPALTRFDDANAVYLDGDLCPSGTAHCTAVETCPEQGLNIFTADGEECYALKDVRTAQRARLQDLQTRANTQEQTQAHDPRTLLVAASSLTEVVRAAATLSSRLQNLGHAQIECAQVDSMGGTRDARRAFCGTLRTPSNVRKCVFEDNTCHASASASASASV